MSACHGINYFFSSWTWPAQNILWLSPQIKLPPRNPLENVSHPITQIRLWQISVGRARASFWECWLLWQRKAEESAFLKLVWIPPRLMKWCVFAIQMFARFSCSILFFFQPPIARLVLWRSRGSISANDRVTVQRGSARAFLTAYLNTGSQIPKSKMYANLAMFCMLMHFFSAFLPSEGLHIQVGEALDEI